ncbi:calcium uptake protein 1, mitochondrial-like [Paramacrobiotus metropolitanus]|uniref:calcium uptake protein 1, mitochondrial-like n=1 Tax=Paramacrobiotus metropolitanus TaxID=2943436 RepID=UPI0024457A60|nr:calcium uptake protein 1, mitochondrial-like [Paramacrobiotus metropolitanus]
MAPFGVPYRALLLTSRWDIRNTVAVLSRHSVSFVIPSQPIRVIHARRPVRCLVLNVPYDPLLRRFGRLSSLQASVHHLRFYTGFARISGRPSRWEEKQGNLMPILFALFVLGLGIMGFCNGEYFHAEKFSPVKRADDLQRKEQFDEDAYVYGVENLPRSYVASYELKWGKARLPDGRPIVGPKTVEAAERPARDAHIKGTVNNDADDDVHGSSDGLDAEERKQGGFRNRKITEYENRIRAYSTPDKVFRLFATLKIKDPDADGYGIYMTPDDFVRAITPGVRQPEGLGLDQFRLFDPTKDKIESNIPEDSIFHKLGERGLISFSDYLFLMTILAISARHIEIAFKIFDVNGDGTVDADEFEEILNVLRSQTSVGIRHREAKLMGGSYGGTKFVDSGLKTFFFGKSGTGKLKVQDFLAFQAKMKDEVLRMEFERMEPKSGKISERTFAKMLLTYAGISEQKQKRMLKRVKERFQGEASEGIGFEQVHGFSQVFRHLNDIDTALGLYHVAGGSIDHSTLKRVVKTVAKTELDDHVIDVVFTLFDDNEDGRLSQREFISIMKTRQMRGMERPKDMGVTRLLGAVWKCTKEEIQGSRH